MLNKDSVGDGLAKAQILLSEELLSCKVCAAAAGEVLPQRCAAQSAGTTGLLPSPAVLADPAAAAAGSLPCRWREWNEAAANYCRDATGSRAAHSALRRSSAQR